MTYSPLPLGFEVKSQIIATTFLTVIRCKKAFSNFCSLKQAMKTSRHYLNSILDSRKGFEVYVQSQTYLTQPQFNSCYIISSEGAKEGKTCPRDPSRVPISREMLNWKLENLHLAPSKKKYHRGSYILRMYLWFECFAEEARWFYTASIIGMTMSFDWKYLHVSWWVTDLVMCNIWPFQYRRIFTGPWVFVIMDLNLDKTYLRKIALACWK